MKLLCKFKKVSDHIRTGKQARKRRLARNLSQAAVALRMGVSSVFVSYLERGLRNWNPATLAAFTKATHK